MTLAIVDVLVMIITRMKIITVRAVIVRRVLIERAITSTNRSNQFWVIARMVAIGLRELALGFRGLRMLCVWSLQGKPPKPLRQEFKPPVFQNP